MLTVFCDIDGTLFKWKWPWDDEELCPNVKEKYQEWLDKGYYIILTTARDESYREMTEAQLMRQGLFYHLLIMGLPDYPRHIINDEKHDCVSCVAHVLKRNAGFGDLLI